jgi:uncharacterized protein (DUF1330 family)
MSKFDSEQQVEEFFNDIEYLEFQELMRSDTLTHLEEKAYNESVLEIGGEA